MALVYATYQAELIALFQEMLSSDDETLFARGLTQATINFIATGTITTTDAGTVSAGVYSGLGTLSPVTVTDEHTSSDIQDVCDNMYLTNKAWGDAQYNYTYAVESGASAEEIARLKAELDQAESAAMSGEDMMRDICYALCDLMEDTAFSIQSTGTVTFTGGSSALSGTMDGSFTGSRDTFYNEVISACQSMSSMTSGGDEYFAEVWARAFYTYLLGGTVTSSGTGVLAGAVGTGGIA